MASESRATTAVVRRLVGDQVAASKAWMKPEGRAAVMKGCRAMEAASASAARNLSTRRRRRREDARRRRNTLYNFSFSTANHRSTN